MSGSDRIALIGQRLAFIRRRLDELELRRRQLHDRPSGHGSSDADVELSAASVTAALRRARTAYADGLQALELSARAHDSAALAHERIASRSSERTHEHERSAEAHRAAAELDRCLASEERGGDHHAA
jgi:hypothetical protein